MYTRGSHGAEHLTMNFDFRTRISEVKEHGQIRQILDLIYKPDIV